MVTLSSIQNEVNISNTAWINLTINPMNAHLSSLRYCILMNSQPFLSTSYTTNPVSVMFTVIIHENLTWQLFVGNQLIRVDTIPCLSSIPPVVNSDDVQNILNILQRHKICPGNPDANYVEMVRSKKDGKMTSRKGQSITTAFIDDSKGVEINEQIFQCTVRTSDCAIIIPDTSTRRCEKCVKYRDTLRSSYANYIKPKADATMTDPSSHVNMRYITTPQRKSRVIKRTRQVGLQTRRIQRLEQKLANLIKEKGVAVDTELHTGLTQIMNSHSADTDILPDGSLKKIFWQQQLKAASLKDMRQIRWHPVIIKWCLGLKLKSYSAMKDTGFIKLPSECTLRDYTHVFQAKCGIQAEVNDQLAKEANLDELEPWQTNVCIIFDEVKIKDGLVYDKYSGYIMGFTELGDTNKYIDELEAKDKLEEVATSMLVFMVRGLFIRLAFPYAQFPCRSLSAATLYPIFWDVVRNLERTGFKVVALTGDGVSYNRKLFDMHGSTGGCELVNKVKNCCADEERYKYFLSDVPHLLKTVRNCFANSFAHSRYRQLWVWYNSYCYRFYIFFSSTNPTSVGNI